MAGTVDDSGDTRPSRQGRAVPYLVLGLECDRPAAGGARYSLEGVDCVTVGRGDARVARRHTD